MYIIDTTVEKFLDSDLFSEIICFNTNRVSRQIESITSCISSNMLFVWKTVDIFELLRQLDLLGLSIGRAAAKHQDVGNPPATQELN